MKLVAFTLPILLFGVFVYLKQSFPEFYFSLIQEDSILENFQAVCCLAATATAMLCSRQFFLKKQILDGILFGVFGTGLLLITGEEISWGQRIFQFATPDYFEKNNTQLEATLHNLSYVQSRLEYVYLFVGLFGSFSWTLRKTVFAHVPPKYGSIVGAFLPEWFLSPYFFFLFLLHFAFLLLPVSGSGDFLVWRDQEPIEALLSIGFLLIAVVTLSRLRHLPDQPRSQ